jgi:hypothetical protein
MIWLNISYGEWVKSKDSLKKVVDDLSDSEFEKDTVKEQKELPTEKDKTANNEKVVKEISKLKSWYNLIHQDLLKQEIQEGTWKLKSLMLH